MASTRDLSKLTYAELKQIADEANELLKTKRSEELGTLVDGWIKDAASQGFSMVEIVEAIKPHWPGKGGVKAAAGKRSDAGVKAPVKYRGPDGEEWSGRGQTPKWMKPLLEKGKRKEDFLI